MRRLAYLDCIGGVAGDMLLAAFLDAGASLEALRAVPQLLGVRDVEIEVARETYTIGTSDKIPQGKAIVDLVDRFVTIGTTGSAKRDGAAARDAIVKVRADERYRRELEAAFAQYEAK